MITFRCNGYIYNQGYAWIPTQMTSGAWVWLTPYYSRETKRDGWISMAPFEFILDCSRGDE
jgi:hypothetical protein